MHCILQPKNQGPLLLEGPGISNVPQDQGTDHKEPGTHRDAITAHTVRRPEIMILGMITKVQALQGRKLAKGQNQKSFNVCA